MDAPLELTGKMLIAMPGMTDPRFANAVIFMCAYSEDGAMGLIVNKPIQEVPIKDLMAQLSIKVSASLADTSLYFGGPVEHGRGFVLHTPEYSSDLSSMKVNASFSMTATLDILEDIAAGTGPQASIVALGYSGWGPGQLENEIAQNGWLICEARPQLVFAASDDEKWQAALKTIGVDPLTLSATAGRA